MHVTCMKVCYVVCTLSISGSYVRLQFEKRLSQKVQNSRTPPERHGYIPGCSANLLLPLLGCHCTNPYFLLAAHSLLEKKAQAVWFWIVCSFFMLLVMLQGFLSPFRRPLRELSINIACSTLRKSWKIHCIRRLLLPKANLPGEQFFLAATHFDDNNKTMLPTGSTDVLKALRHSW